MELVTDAINNTIRTLIKNNESCKEELHQEFSRIVREVNGYRQTFIDANDFYVLKESSVSLNYENQILLNQYAVEYQEDIVNEAVRDYFSHGKNLIEDSEDE